MENETIPEQTINNWLDEESQNLKNNNTTTFEILPSLKLSPGKITELEIDVSKPFEAWNGEQNGKTITKKIIPCIVKGERINWWLNVRNPIYREIIEKCKNGTTHFKVTQTGTQAETKYTLLED